MTSEKENSVKVAVVLPSQRKAEPFPTADNIPFAMHSRRAVESKAGVQQRRGRLPIQIMILPLALIVALVFLVAAPVKLIGGILFQRPPS